MTPKYAYFAVEQRRRPEVITDANFRLQLKQGNEIERNKNTQPNRSRQPCGHFGHLDRGPFMQTMAHMIASANGKADSRCILFNDSYLSTDDGRPA